MRSECGARLASVTTTTIDQRFSSRHAAATAEAIVMLAAAADAAGTGMLALLGHVTAGYHSDTPSTRVLVT